MGGELYPEFEQDGEFPGGMDVWIDNGISGDASGLMKKAVFVAGQDKTKYDATIFINMYTNRSTA